MPHWFFDPFGIGVELDSIRAMSLHDGKDEYDGCYVISLTIIVAGSKPWEMSMLYNQRDTRDSIAAVMRERLQAL